MGTAQRQKRKGEVDQAAAPGVRPTYNARSNDPDSWGTYDEAVATVAAGNADGIGYMLLGSGIGAIDLDHVEDRDIGKLKRWAEQLQAEAHCAYQEVTVSGSGLRIIGTASGPEVQRKFTFERDTGAGIELYRDTARYITVSGLEVGECAALPPIDGLIETLLARHGGGPARMDDGPLDFNAADRQRLFDYDALIRNGAPEGERSEAFAAVVWHLAGQGWSPEQIADELAKHPNGIGAKYAGRLLTEVSRCFRNGAHRSARRPPAARRRRASGRRFSSPKANCRASSMRPKRRCRQWPRGLPARWSAGAAAAVANHPGQRRLEVHATDAAVADRGADPRRALPQYNARAKAYVPVDAPDEVADALLSRSGKWKLPVLAGITRAPFVRRDGTLCETPDYDAASGVLYKRGGDSFPPVPQQPSKADAAEALALLDRLLDGFPFVSRAARAVALSAILTMLDRRSMTAAPLHAFSSPAAGTGKSLLVDVVALLATRRKMPVISQGARGSEEELEKRLGAALLAGDAAISLDNCEHPLQGSFLCQALTQQTLNIRLLGLSRNVETPVNAAIFATGNNLTVVGDLTRRTLICGLDAHCERPELRTFADDVVDTVLRERGLLVAAALTVLRAWHVSGERVGVVPFGSFESWSYRVREPLMWLDCADPCETVAKVREDDPRRTALLTVVVQWREALGTDSAHTLREILAAAVSSPDFHNALLTVAGARSGNVVSNDRLGRWLKTNEGKIVNRLSLVRDGIANGYPLWRLAEDEAVNGGGQWT